MRELQHKQKLRRFIYSTPSLVALAVIAALFFKGMIGVVKKEHESRAKVEELNKKYTELGKRETMLNGALVRLGTEEGLEEEIRSKFNAVEEGEKVVVIVDPKYAKEEPAPPKKPWYKKWWSAIIH